MDKLTSTTSTSNKSKVFEPTWHSSGNSREGKRRVRGTHPVCLWVHAGCRHKKWSRTLPHPTPTNQTMPAPTQQTLAVHEQLPWSWWRKKRDMHPKWMAGSTSKWWNLPLESILYMYTQMNTNMCVCLLLPATYLVCMQKNALLIRSNQYCHRVS